MNVGTNALLIASILIIGKIALASAPEPSEMKCTQAMGFDQASDSLCTAPQSTIVPSVPDGSIALLLSLHNSHTVGISTGTPAGTKGVQPNAKIVVSFFNGKGCSHCQEEKLYLTSLKQLQPALEIREYEVWYNKENARLLAAMLRASGVSPSGVPVTFIHNQVFSGFSIQTRTLIENAVDQCKRLSCGDPLERLRGVELPEPAERALPFGSPASDPKSETSVSVPLLGTLNATQLSLPLLTIVIAGMDSFNPCAFFVLLSLLGLLVHARSRNKMFLIGGIFVFFSGFIYFLFMAAWLNMFLIMGHVAFITTVAGWVSVVIAAINIKDFFLFKQGVSLTIPDIAKPRLFERMRRLLHSTSLVSILIGTMVLSVVANTYELLCTAGFPMVFTRILTLNNLSEFSYYLYLFLYNIVYTIPLLVIVTGFTVTLGKRQLSEWQGRVLKLVSGVMMVGLGAVLLINPALLNSVTVSIMILALAPAISLLVATVTKRLRR